MEWQEHLKALYNDYYYVRQDDLWRAKAMEKLPALLGATDMLVCGEDLGMVPACVPGVPPASPPCPPAPPLPAPSRASLRAPVSPLPSARE